MFSKETFNAFLDQENSENGCLTPVTVIGGVDVQCDCSYLQRYCVCGGGV